MNGELVPRTAQLRLRTVILLYHGTAAAAAAAIAAASRHGLQILSMFSVAVELPCRRDAIILSLPCSSFELIPLNVATTQEHWGSDQVIFKDNKLSFSVDSRLGKLSRNYDILNAQQLTVTNLILKIHLRVYNISTYEEYYRTSNDMLLLRS